MLSSPFSSHALSSRHGEAHHRSSQQERGRAYRAARPAALALSEGAFRDGNLYSPPVIRSTKDDQDTFLGYFKIVMHSSGSFGDSDAGPAGWRGRVRDYNADVSPFPARRNALIQLQEWIALSAPASVPSSESSRTLGTWLREALRQLEESHECAVDEELSPPSSVAIQKTETLLCEMSKCIESAPDIYPMRESSLAIDFRVPDGRSGVLFVIERDGSGALFYPTRGRDGWTSVEDAASLFKKHGADELKRAGIR